MNGSPPGSPVFLFLQQLFPDLRRYTATAYVSEKQCVIIQERAGGADTAAPSNADVNFGKTQCTLPDGVHRLYVTPWTGVTAQHVRLDVPGSMSPTVGTTHAPEMVTLNQYLEWVDVSLDGCRLPHPRVHRDGHVNLKHIITHTTQDVVGHTLGYGTFGYVFSVSNDSHVVYKVTICKRREPYVVLVQMNEFAVEARVWAYSEPLTHVLRPLEHPFVVPVTDTTVCFVYKKPRLAATLYDVMDPFHFLGLSPEGRTALAVYILYNILEAQAEFRRVTDLQHNDLQGKNFMVDASGGVYIIDYGCAGLDAGYSTYMRSVPDHPTQNDIAFLLGAYLVHPFAEPNPEGLFSSAGVRAAAAMSWHKALVPHVVPATVFKNLQKQVSVVTQDGVLLYNNLTQDTLEKTCGFLRTTYVTCADAGRRLVQAAVCRARLSHTRVIQCGDDTDPNVVRVWGVYQPPTCTLHYCKGGDHTQVPDIPCGTILLGDLLRAAVVLGVQPFPALGPLLARLDLVNPGMMEWVGVSYNRTSHEWDTTPDVARVMQQQWGLTYVSRLLPWTDRPSMAPEDFLRLHVAPLPATLGGPELVREILGYSDVDPHVLYASSDGATSVYWCPGSPFVHKLKVVQDGQRPPPPTSCAAPHILAQRTILNPITGTMYNASRMKYIGPTLLSVLVSSTTAGRLLLPPKMLRGLVLLVASAVTAFHHATGLVHGDATLENLLVGSDGNLTLVDLQTASPPGTLTTPSQAGSLYTWSDGTPCAQDDEFQYIQDVLSDGWDDPVVGPVWVPALTPATHLMLHTLTPDTVASTLKQNAVYVNIARKYLRVYTPCI